MLINIASKTINFRGYKEGYLDKTWAENECPLNVNNLRIGDVVEYDFGKYSSKIYVIKILNIYIKYGQLNVWTEVVDIKNKYNREEFAENYK